MDAQKLVSRLRPAEKSESLTTDLEVTLGVATLFSNLIMVVVLVTQFVRGGGESSEPSALFDRLLLTVVLTTTYGFLFTKIRHLRKKAVEARRELSQSVALNNKIPDLIRAFHNFNHDLRDCVELLDIGFQQLALAPEQRQIMPDEIKRRSKEKLVACLDHAASIFSSITDSSCASAIKTVDEISIKPRKQDSNKKIIRTYVRDRSSERTRSEYEVFISENELDDLNANTHYKALISPKPPWIIRFDSKNDPKRKKYTMASYLPWNNKGTEEAPESQIYCACSQSKVLLGQIQNAGFTDYSTFGVLYIDSDKEHVFNDTHDELAFAFADALFKICEYRLKFSNAVSEIDKTVK